MYDTNVGSTKEDRNTKLPGEIVKSAPFANSQTKQIMRCRRQACLLVTTQHNA